MIKFVLFLIFILNDSFSEEIDLGIYERSIYSRNGEDGVLAKIFQLVIPDSKFCVQFGGYDGVTDSNTYLLRLQGWKSVQFDRQYQIPKHNLYKEFITAESINEVFDRYQVPENLDLLSIDIGYNDFYIWEALDTKYQPAVIVIAYNATHPPHEDKIVKYRPFYVGDDTNYYGASILAMHRLGKSKGYRLVYAETNGRNLFFIREDLLMGCVEFKNMDDVEKLYRPSSDRLRLEDDKQRSYLSSEDILK